jgi:hypothetical protein
LTVLGQPLSKTIGILAYFLFLICYGNSGNWQLWLTTGN